MIESDTGSDHLVNLCAIFSLLFARTIKTGLLMGGVMLIFGGVFYV